MKTKSFIILSAILCIQHYASAGILQPQIGAKWFYTMRGCCSPDVGYYSLEYVKDTTINAKNCMILEGIGNNRGGQFGNCRYCILNENKRVYQYLNSNFHLLYDFNVNIGDTIKSTYSFLKYNYGSLQFEYNDRPMSLKVTEVEDTLINSELLKTYSYSAINSNSLPNYDCIEFEGKAIETIGNYTNVFFPENCSYYNDSFRPISFRCFQNENSLVKSNDYYGNLACDYTNFNNGLKENSVSNQVKIQLNSDNNSFTVKGIDNTKRKFKVLDSTGKIFMNSELQKDVPVAIDNLCQGIYMLILEDDTTYISLRFIKN